MSRTDDLPSLKGQMLIASPAIGDPRFHRSLVYVCVHDDDYAMGIIVNQVLDNVRLPELLKQLEIDASIRIPDRPVLNGGPMDRDRGFVLHSDDFASGDSTLDVGDGVGLTATKDVLEAIVSPEAPRQSVLALGYAGWGPGQLESELQANAWLTCAASEALIFGDDMDAKWAEALASIGVSPERLSSLSGEA